MWFAPLEFIVILKIPYFSQARKYLKSYALLLRNLYIYTHINLCTRDIVLFVTAKHQNSVIYKCYILWYFTYTVYCRLPYPLFSLHFTADMVHIHLHTGDEGVASVFIKFYIYIYIYIYIYTYIYIYIYICVYIQFILFGLTNYSNENKIVQYVLSALTCLLDCPFTLYANNHISTGFV